MIYLDTSALIKLYLLEEGSQEVFRAVSVQDHPLPVWELQEVELINALRLKVFRKELEESAADRQIELFFARKASGQYFYPSISRSDLLDEFHATGKWTMQIGCRSLDLMHVACALHIRAEFFMTFDLRQRELARLVGLHLV